MLQPTDWRQGIRNLLDTCCIGFLATQGKDGPETSMAPYATHQGHILLHLSSLARHTANIDRQASAGLMICTPETAMQSPLALPRLSLQGCISAVAEEGLEAARASYLRRIPEAEALFGFADFRLFCLDPVRIHWVGGFGSARDIPVPAWQDICCTGNPGASEHGR